jgi:hypothetical protein
MYQHLAVERPIDHSLKGVGLSGFNLKFCNVTITKFNIFCTQEVLIIIYLHFILYLKMLVLLDFCFVQYGEYFL